MLTDTENDQILITTWTKDVQSYSTLMMDVASMTLEKRYGFDRQTRRYTVQMIKAPAQVSSPFVSPFLIPSPDSIMNPHGFPFRMTVDEMIELCSPMRSRISLLTECAGRCATWYSGVRYCVRGVESMWKGWDLGLN